VHHFPHVEAPQRFVETLEDFCATTDPVVFDAATWRARMRVTQAPD
jgi:NAD-dependent oxidoreductase involved in siderophore biosynthesis